MKDDAPHTFHYVLRELHAIKHKPIRFKLCLGTLSDRWLLNNLPVFAITRERKKQNGLAKKEMRMLLWNMFNLRQGTTKNKGRNPLQMYTVTYIRCASWPLIVIISFLFLLLIFIIQFYHRLEVAGPAFLLLIYKNITLSRKRYVCLFFFFLHKKSFANRRV